MENELYHWGIRGQKWGVRRYQNPDGTLTEAGRARYGAKYKTMQEVRDAQKSDKRVAKALKTGVAKKLTDEELRKVSDRLRAEQSYKQMYDNLNPKHRSRAKRVIADIAENAAKDLARRAFTNIGEKIFNKKDDTISEYSLSELDQLTDKQMKEFMQRQANKKLIAEHENNFHTAYEKIEAREAEKNKAEQTAKEARQAAKEAEQRAEYIRRAEQKAQRDRERHLEEEMMDRVSKSKYDSWMKSDYSNAFDFSSKSDSGRKKAQEYSSLKIDSIFDSMDDYYDSTWGENRKRKDLAKWSDIGENFLAHHGIKGQKWGVRRYQNLDGTWTEAGKKRYGSSYFFELEKTGGWSNNKDKINKMASKVDRDNNRWAKAQFRIFRKNMDEAARRAGGKRIKNRATPYISDGANVLDRVRALENRGGKVTRDSEQYTTDFNAEALSRARKEYEKAYRQYTKDMIEYYKDSDGSTASSVDDSYRNVTRLGKIYKSTLESTCNDILGIYGKIPATKIVKYTKGYKDVLSDTLSKAVSEKAYSEVRDALLGEYLEEMDKLNEYFNKNAT